MLSAAAEAIVFLIIRCIRSGPKCPFTGSLFAPDNLPAELHLPNQTFYAFAPCSPGCDVPPLGEVPEYRQLSNHPRSSVGCESKRSVCGRTLRPAFDTLYLSGAH